MLKSRVSSSLDTARLGQALARPGMDTRTWVSYAIVNAIHLDADEGIFVDVTLMPTQRTATARLGVEYAGNGFGLYAPLEVDDEVLVEVPNGDAANGMVVTRRLFSPSDPPPAEALSHPTDVLLVVRQDQTLRIITKGAGNLVIQAEGTGEVRLGNESAGQPVLRGNAYLSAEASFLTALGTFASTCTTIPGGTPAATLNLAITAFKNALGLTTSKVKVP